MNSTFSRFCIHRAESPIVAASGCPSTSFSPAPSAAVSRFRASKILRLGLKTSIYFEPTRATAPFFHVTDSRDQTYRVSKRFDYYDSTLRGPSMFLTVEDAAHAELVSLTGVVPHAVLPNASSPDVRRRYALGCRYVESFLSDTMKGDSDAADFLDVTPSRHGFDGLILSRRR